MAIAQKSELQNRLHLAAAIAPRRREKSAQRQFSPLGKASCVPEPGRGLQAREVCPPFFASRAAVSRPASVDYKTSWLDENEPCFKTRIAENRDIVLQSTFMSKPYSMALQGISAAEVEGKGVHLQP